MLIYCYMSVMRAPAQQVALFIVSQIRGGAGMKQNIQVIKKGGRMVVKVRQGRGGEEEERKVTDKERK